MAHIRKWPKGALGFIFPKREEIKQAEKRARDGDKKLPAICVKSKYDKLYARQEPSIDQK